MPLVKRLIGGLDSGGLRICGLSFGAAPLPPLPARRCHTRAFSILGKTECLSATSALFPHHSPSIINGGTKRFSHDDSSDSTIFPGEFWHTHEGENQNSSTSKGDRKYLSILHLNAAHSYESLVSTAARELTESLRIPYRLKEVDLWKQLDHYDGGYATAKMRILQGKGTAEDLQKMEPVFEMAKEINVVDALMVSTPMWNYR